MKVHVGKEIVSGYYRNLGSLRAGTRHHGETLSYGNSFPPTFPEVLLAHGRPIDRPIVAKHANMMSLRGSINAEPRGNPFSHNQGHAAMLTCLGNVE